MPAVPRRIDSVLRRLEAARHRRPGSHQAERAIGQARRLVPGSAAELVRLHEALLFLRAYPHSRRVRDRAEAALETIPARVAALEASGEDMSRFDAPEDAGIAGTTVGTDFSFDLARWLAIRFGRNVRIDWDAAEPSDRMRASWPEFLPLLEEEGYSDANVPYLAWLAAAAGGRKWEPGWLFDRYSSLRVPEPDRAEHFDALGLPIAWSLGRSRASRTRMRLPGPPPFFQDEPFLARRDVSLDAALTGPTLSLRRLGRRDGERLCDLFREATCARYRELYQFTYADPTSVVAARPGRGLEIFLVGVSPGRRLPLRSAYGGFIVRNGVPVGYTEGLAFLERLEIGFNVYYTFREGESAWIYAQMLRLHHAALGVTSFSVDPYQIGFENSEAIDSGAFWFYRKLGFRPTDAGVARLLAREEARMAADPAHRSSRRTLERLVTHNLLYEVPGRRGREWDRFHIRNLGLAVNRRMRTTFGGDAGRMRRETARGVARALAVNPARWEPLERKAFDDLALVLELVPDLRRWSREERCGVVEVIRSKAGRHERRYLALLQRHPRLRRALLRLGSD